VQEKGSAVGDWIDQLIFESQQHFQEAWSRMAKAGPTPVVETRGEVDLAIAGVRLGLFNAAFPRGPLAGPNAVRQAASTAREAFAALGVPGLFTLPSSWLPAGGAAALAELGFRPELSNSGMRTARLEEPQRYLGPPRAFRIDPGVAAEWMARVNGLAYGMSPAEWESMVLPRLWMLPEVSSYAVEEGGEVAAVGAAILQNDCCYLMWMATRPEWRRRGMAEKIVRAAWDDARASGARLTALHATPAGRPVYSRLGYTRIADFPGFVWSPATAG